MPKNETKGARGKRGSIPRRWNDGDGPRAGVPALHDVALGAEQRRRTRHPIAELRRVLRPVFALARGFRHMIVDGGEKLGGRPLKSLRALGADEVLDRN